MVITDAVIWTGSPASPWAQALWVEDGIIRAVGSNREVLDELPQGTQLQSAEGAFICPGLVDAHAHLLSFGLQLQRVDLVGAVSLDASLSRISSVAVAMDAAEQPGWLRGRGWDQNDWPHQVFPTAADLDRVTGDRPAVFERIDGHAVWVNSAALEKAGITRETPDPNGGKIERDDQGHPTGVLIDNAEELIWDVVPEPDRLTKKHSLRAAAQVLTAAGLTTVHDMGMNADDLAVYRELSAEEDLGLRVYAAFSATDTALNDVLADGPDEGWQGGWFRLGMVKFYLDGALGSRGAALIHPYSDDQGNRGLLVTSQEDFSSTLPRVLSSGFQAAVHAIGDRGNRMALDTWGTARAAAPDPPGVPEPAGSYLGSPQSIRPQMRVEHAQIIEPGDLDRFAELQVVASMQPTHCTSDMPWAPLRLGPDRLEGAYAWRSLRQRGVLLACGSDFPVESHDPLKGIYAAVTRKPPGEDHPGWSPHERLARQEALVTFTAAPAYVSGDLDRLGTLAPGMEADFVVWDRNLITCDPESVLDAEVIRTVIRGKTVFTKEKQ